MAVPGHQEAITNYGKPERRHRLFALTLPIIGGMVSHNLTNIVNTAVVGLLGVAALAAANVLKTVLLFAILQGLSLRITRATLFGQALG